MLQVAADLSTIRIGAGEPFLLELAFEDRRGVRRSIEGRAFVASIFDDLRVVRGQLAGELLTEAGGAFVRFAEEGALSEALYGKVGLRVEIAEEYRHGRQVIATPALSIAATAATVPSLGDDGAIGGEVSRVTLRDVPRRLPIIRIDVLPFVAAPVSPPAVTLMMDFRSAANALYLGAML